jgi:hypothetical protein
MTNSTSAYGVTPARETFNKGLRKIDLTIYPGMPMLIMHNKHFPMTFAEGDIQNFNQQFIDILEDLRLDVQEKGIDLTGYDHPYLVQLRDVGRAAFNKILSKEARQYLVKLETETKAQKRQLSLNFRIPPTFSLFWEMIYAGQPFKVETDQFWGFRYPLGRIYWDLDEIDLVRLQQGVFSSIHHQLEHSRYEIEELSKYLAQLCDSMGLQVTLKLLDQLIPPETLSVERIIELFHSDEFRYGMVHFACHCENPQDGGATQSYLSLTAHEQELALYLEKLLSWNDYGFCHTPFVFLNACGSATHGHLLQTSSFPNEVLNFGAAGVIATACTIPDNFASRFASEFYHRLLTKPAADVPIYISQTLLETRRYFLETSNNPLGLAYGLYAVSDQQLRLVD